MIGVDIFEVGRAGQVRWLEAVRDLDAAMARLKAIAAQQPGTYLIFDYRTGNKTFVDHTRLPIGSPAIQTNSQSADLLRKLQDALATTLRHAHTDMGTLQRLDPDTKSLRIVASIGFGVEFLDHFRQVHPGNTSCGAALAHAQTVTVGDVSSDPVFSDDARAVILAAGSRAVQSIPLVGGANGVVGVISPHYRIADPPPLRQRQAEIPRQHLQKITSLIEALRESVQAPLQPTTS